MHVSMHSPSCAPSLVVVAGVTTEVDLQPGQLLLYESAKCTHGRPRTFRGNWYTSMFIHYRPQEYNLKPNAERNEMVWLQRPPPPTHTLRGGLGRKRILCCCRLSRPWSLLAARVSLIARWVLAPRFHFFLNTKMKPRDSASSRTASPPRVCSPAPGAPRLARHSAPAAARAARTHGVRHGLQRARLLPRLVPPQPGVAGHAPDCGGNLGPQRRGPPCWDIHGALTFL